MPRRHGGHAALGFHVRRQVSPGPLDLGRRGTGSTNPLIEYHVISAVVLIVLAITAAGNRWELGKAWARLPPADTTRRCHDERRNAMNGDEGQQRTPLRLRRVELLRQRAAAVVV